MSIAVTSTTQLAREVEAKVELPPGGAVAPVPELAATPSTSCDSTALLGWMGWMTAGPSTLAAEVLRNAGCWAFVRYRWALEDDGRVVRTTSDARSIRQHTRSTFSEAVGIGIAGHLGCDLLAPSGALAVINLDDSMEPLLRNGAIRRRSGWAKKHPDYLVVAGLDAATPRFFAIECKGTVKNEKAAIAQLAAGVKQVVGIESDLPLRRVIFATSLELDDPRPSVGCSAVEVVAPNGREGSPELRDVRAAIRDAALIRSLRCVGRYAAAERVKQGYQAETSEPEESFRIEERPMAGRMVELVSAGSRLRAEVGVDLRFLRELESSRAEGPVRREEAAFEVPGLESDRRLRFETPDEVRQEVLMRDGFGLRFEQQGRELRGDDFLQS